MSLQEQLRRAHADADPEDVVSMNRLYRIMTRMGYPLPEGDQLARLIQQHGFFLGESQRAGVHHIIPRIPILGTFPRGYVRSGCGVDIYTWTLPGDRKARICKRCTAMLQRDPKAVWGADDDRYMDLVRGVLKTLRRVNLDASAHSTALFRMHAEVRHCSEPLLITAISTVRMRIRYLLQKAVEECRDTDERMTYGAGRSGSWYVPYEVYFGTVTCRQLLQSLEKLEMRVEQAFLDERARLEA